MDDTAWLELAREAARCWPLRVERITLAARRKNLVFRLTAVTGQDFGLRVHRAGYRSAAELSSELAWMQALAQGGLTVSAPLPSLNGGCWKKWPASASAVLLWLPGAPLGRSGRPLRIERREAVFHELGGTLAQLHQVSDAWRPPPGFTRSHWGLGGLLGP